MNGGGNATATHNTSLAMELLLRWLFLVNSCTQRKLSALLLFLSSRALHLFALGPDSLAGCAIQGCWSYGYWYISWLFFSSIVSMLLSIYLFWWCYFFSRLGLHLPHKVDPDGGKAKWLSKDQVLEVTLRLVRPLDDLNHWLIPCTMLNFGIQCCAHCNCFLANYAREPHQYRSLDNTFIIMIAFMEWRKTVAKEFCWFDQSDCRSSHKHASTPDLSPEIALTRQLFLRLSVLKACSHLPSCCLSYSSKCQLYFAAMTSAIRLHFLSLQL